MARMTDGVFRADEPVAQEGPWAPGLPGAAAGQNAVVAAPPAVPAWAPVGPGWHDSSWLLRRGLEVTEW